MHELITIWYQNGAHLAAHQHLNREMTSSQDEIRALEGMQVHRQVEAGMKHYSLG